MCAVSFTGITRGLRGVPAPAPHRPAFRPAPSEVPPVAPPVHLPFVTLASQPGAAIPGLPDRLVAALIQRDGRPWAVWDQALVQKVATEENLPIEFISRVEAADPSWLDDCLAGFFDAPDSMHVERRLAGAVRDLAAAGRAVFVGHGAAFITRHIPAGLRVHLVAPREHRINAIATTLQLSHKRARDRIARLEKTRRAFLRRYWPEQSLADPATFDLTLNTTAAPADALVQSILALVPTDGAST